MEDSRLKRHLVGGAFRKTEDNKKYTVITLSEVDRISWQVGRSIINKLVVGLKATCEDVPSRPGTFVAVGEFTCEQISGVIGNMSFSCEVVVGQSKIAALCNTPMP